MIPNMKLTLKFAHGDSTVEVRPRSQMAFERKFDLAIGDAFSGEEGGFRFEHIYFLAWHASRSSVSFEEWSDSDELLGIDVEVEGMTDPTLPAPSAGS